jgi:hypothetical protein
MACHERKLSATLMIPTTTYAEIYELWVWMVGEYEFGSGGAEDMEAVQMFPFVPLFPSLLFSSLLSSLLIGFRPGTNGVGTGFYHLPMEVEFPRAPDPPKGRH